MVLVEEGRVWTILIVLILHFSSIRGISAPNIIYPPRLLPDNSSIIVDAGDNVTLTCSGDYPLEWQSDLMPPIRDLIDTAKRVRDLTLTFTNTSAVDGSGGYESMLHYVFADSSFTGRFWCRYKDKPTFNATIYVYVYDPDNLLTSLHKLDIHPYWAPLHLRMYPNTPLKVLCKPTHPDVQITLVKAPKVSRKTVTIGQDVTYKPTEGFNFLFPNSFLNGMFYCVASFRGTTNEKIFILHYIDTNKKNVPKPVIKADKRELLVGESVLMTCTVPFDIATHVLMHWNYTSLENESSSEHSSRIRKTKPLRSEVKRNGYTFALITSELEVRDARVTDKGVYRCTVSMYSSATNYTEITIDVFEKTFVYLHPSEKGVYAEYEDEYAMIRIPFYAYPVPNVTWYKDGEEIFDNYIYKFGRNDYELTLMINYPTSQHSGRYTVIAVTADMTSSASLTFIVRVKPSVSVTKSKTGPYYLLNGKFTTKCHAEGVPVPAITWQWQPCSKAVCIMNESNWQEMVYPFQEPAAFGSNLASMMNTVRNSSLALTAKESGWIRCYAENILGSAYWSELFIVTDAVSGLELTLTEPEIDVVVEHDNVTMECRASVWKYTFVNIQRGNSTVITTNQGGFDAISPQTSSNYSLLRTVSINDVQISESGVYMCLAKSRSGGLVTRKLTLVVLGAVLPTFTKSLTGTVYHKAGVETALECYATGLPTPRITWFKDGLRLMEGKLPDGLVLTNNGNRLLLVQTSANVSGQYSCKAENREGSIISNTSLIVGSIPVSNSGLSPVHIGIIVAIFIIAVIISAIIILVIRRKMKYNVLKELEDMLLNPPIQFDPELPLEEQADCIPYNPKWEFPKDRLRLGKILGQGAFGRVVKAEAVGILEGIDVSAVAVKMVKDCTDKEQMQALLSELKILIHVGQHLNIVNLLGAVTKDITKGELYVIVEYCQFGSLRAYIIQHKDGFCDTMDDVTDAALDKRREASGAMANPYYINKAGQPNESAFLIGPALTTKNLTCYAYQVARGMAYLSSKNYIHRDLAARNVLLSEDNIVKICDFGLAKKCYTNPEYHKKGDGPVPVKWMAIESLTHRLYTSKSDVWSFGIFLWEIFSLGGNPYPGIEINEMFVIKLKDGYRMDRPAWASQEMYKVMKTCWQPQAKQRPTFEELVETMGEFLDQNVKQYYLDLNAPYQDSDESAPVAQALNEPDNYLRMSGVDYTAMSSQDVPDTDEENLPYLNVGANQRKGDAGELVEMQLMLPPPRDNKGGNSSSDKDQLQTEVQFHKREDSDSGHSSTCPQTDDGYLIPKNDHLPHDSLVFRPAPHARHFTPDSARSNASSGFHSDYLSDDMVPPAYSTVMADILASNAV